MLFLEHFDDKLKVSCPAGVCIFLICLLCFETFFGHGTGSLTNAWCDICACSVRSFLVSNIIINIAACQFCSFKMIYLQHLPGEYDEIISF